MSDAVTTAAPAAADPAPAAAAPAPAAPAPASASAPADPPVSASVDGTAQPAPAAAPAAAPQDGDKPADPPANAAPESYADFTAPDGLALDADLGANLKAYAKEKGLSQEEAQKLADMGFEAVKKTRDAYQAQFEEMQAKWVADTRADKEFGGDKLSQNLAIAKRALDTFGTPELTALFDQMGLGNHPEIIRYNFRVAQAISEDKLVPGGVKPPAAKTAQGFYSKSGMNP